MEQLLAWNPSVGAACNGLIAGSWYCVAGPSLPTSRISSSPSSAPRTTSTTPPSTSKTTSAPRTSTSTPSTCAQTYTVKSGDSCFAIWTQFSLTEAQLRALNPSLDANCNLQIGQVLCVKPGTAPSTSSSSKPTTTGTACKQNYTIKSGDFCFSVWQQFGITEAQFRAWNPTVNTNCDLQIGQIVCVSK